MLTGKRQTLAREAGAVNRFNKPELAPEATDALNTVRQEMTDQLLPYTQGPRTAATAQNLNPTDHVLRRAIAAQKGGERIGSQGDIVTSVLGGMAGGPVGGIALPLARRAAMNVADRHALDIAQRLIQLHVDPAQAAQVLAQANVPPKVASQVMQLLQRGAQGAVGPAAGIGAADAMRR
jgi:hypothetical protein